MLSLAPKSHASRQDPPALLPGLTDLFAPSALDFQRHAITFGDMVGRVLLLVDYPPRVRPAWLARLFTMPGVVGSLHVTPTQPHELVKRINDSIREFSARLATGGRDALLQQRNEQSLRDAQELLRKIDQEQQVVFVSVVVLFVLATDAEVLEQRTRRVVAAAAAAGLRARTALFQQQDGLTAAGPWALLPPDLAAIAPRNLPSETVAAALPFVGGTVNHGRGIVLGKDTSGGLVIYDRWTPPAEAGIPNPNMTVLATSGAGKSFAIKLLGIREYMLGARLIILDPEREYRDLCMKLGGTWINAAGGGGRINPLEVRPVPADPDDDAPPADRDDALNLRSPLAQHMQRLRTFFALYLKELSDMERASLEDALLAVYAAAGVTWQTDPAILTVWPTVRDLYMYLKSQAEMNPARWERLAILLRQAAEGTDAALWAGQSTVHGTAEFLVIDVQDLQHAEDSVRRAQYFNVLTYAWDLIRRDRGERKMLIVDEAWLLADPRVPQALDFLRDMAKRIRKYAGALTIISQNAVDFLAPEVARQGEAVLGNAATKLLLRQGEKDLEVLPRLLSLSEAEVERLATFRRGQALLVAGNQRVEVRIEAAPAELAIIDPYQAAALGIQAPV